MSAEANLIKTSYYIYIYMCMCSQWFSILAKLHVGIYMHVHTSRTTTKNEFYIYICGEIVKCSK